jgi:hypothetical protein
MWIELTDSKDEFGLGHRSVPQGRGHGRRRRQRHKAVPQRQGLRLQTGRWNVCSIIHGLVNSPPPRPPLPLQLLDRSSDLTPDTVTAQEPPNPNRIIL